MVVLMTISIVPAVCPDSEGAGEAEESDAKFLIDYGNGVTKWYDGDVKGRSADVAVRILTENGIEVSTDPSFTVSGITAKTVGGTSTGGSLSEPGMTGIQYSVSWHFFRWNPTSLSWEEK